MRRSILPAAIMTLAVFTASAAGADDPRNNLSVGFAMGEREVFLAGGARALKSGNPDRGVRLTEQGLGLPLSNRDRGAAHANLCAGYVLLGEHDRAIEHCDRAAKLDPGNWRALQNRGAALFAMGQYDSAIEHLERALAIEPASPELARAMSVMLSYRDDWEAQAAEEDAAEPAEELPDPASDR